VIHIRCLHIIFILLRSTGYRFYPVERVRNQIVDRLRSKNVDIEYMVFEDEGHGFTKFSNLVKALKKSAEFLVEKLR
jgi:Prolyl oligopeptidase family